MKSLTPGRAIRKFCLWCCETSNEVKLCPATDCILWKYRSGKGRPKLSIIRAKCLKDCDGEGWKSVKDCQFDGKKEKFCPLWPYRLGKRPTLSFLKGSAPPSKRSIPKGLLRYQKEKLAQKLAFLSLQKENAGILQADQSAGIKV